MYFFSFIVIKVFGIFWDYFDIEILIYNNKGKRLISICEVNLYCFIEIMYMYLKFR